MTSETKTIEFYWGPRDRMIAECSVPEFFKGKYLMMQVDDQQRDAEGFETLADVKAEIKALRSYMPNATFHRV